MNRPLLLLIAAVCPTLLSCFNDCDRQGCETFSKKASSSISQGIAGAVSLESDVIADGCQICAFSEAGLDVWASPAAVHESAGACQLAATPSMVSFTAIGRYERALDPGEYLVCVSGHTRACIPVTVVAGKVTTLNVKHHYGPSQVAVLDPGGAAFRSEVFTCSGP